MKMLRSQIEIQRNATAVFDLTQDYDRRLEWDCYLREAYLLNDASAAAVGVDAYCRNRFGSSMVTRYISYDRPRVAAVTMLSGPRILKRFSGTWSVKATTNNASMLIFSYHFELIGGRVGRLLLPLARAWFRRDMTQRLLAIKGYMERPLGSDAQA